jgi:hypothetical protein
MKKTFLTLLAVGFISSALFAQTIESIKTMLTLSQYTKAKEDLDKAMGNAKINSKAEAYILKASIYAALSMEETNKNKPAGDLLASDAYTAFNKYKEMDKSMALVSDPVYQNAAVNIYSNYYSSGYNEYSLKNYKGGFEKLQKAAEFSDFLIAQKILSFPLDTNVNILAGITAEQSGNKPEAAKYYSRLADAKIPGADFESIYRFLVGHYFTSKNYELFEKYKAIGAELYPKSEYYKYDKIDFAVGLETELDKKIKAVEEVLAKDPDNYKANQVLGEIIYDTLNSTHEGAVLPANAVDLEKIMVGAFQKAAAAKPNVELSYIYIGDHFINKASKVGDQRTAHTKAMQARTKPGTKASAEDTKKRDDLDKLYGETLEGAREPYEKAADIFAAKPSLDNKDKQQYKKVVSYLSEIYAFKKVMAKAKPAEAAKFAADEKKWNDRYDSIK